MRHVRRLAAGLLSLAILGAVANGWFSPTETTVSELAPGVFFRQTQWQPEFIGCNQGWVVFNDFVLVIDANFPNQADEVIKLIRETTDKPIRFVFDTHYHGDHADGNQTYTKIGATVISSENSKLLFETKGISGFKKSQDDKPAEYGRLDYQQPSIYFPHRMVIDDGTQRVELLHLGHAHTAGDAVAWLPKHGILMTGDACVNGAFNYTGDGNTASWIQVLTELLKLPVKQIVPGHGLLAGKELLETQRRYFVELREAIQTAIDKGRTLEQIKAEIDLPFYKEWTGKPVQAQVENIEHVYKELTK